MRAYSFIELFRLTRTELFALHAKIAAKLPVLAEPECAIALSNMRNICRVLARAKPGPGP